MEIHKKNDFSWNANELSTTVFEKEESGNRKVVLCHSVEKMYDVCDLFSENSFMSLITTIGDENDKGFYILGAYSQHDVKNIWNIISEFPSDFDFANQNYIFECSCV